MQDIRETVAPIALAVARTVLGAVAVLALRGTGLGADPSLLGGLVLAGLLNIRALATLNEEAILPTSHAG
jgi:hypothetical protein